MADTVEIRVDATPNPNSLKFTVNHAPWPPAARTISSVGQAGGMPLAARLLAVAGVKSLFFLRDFLTVTREPDTEWEPLTAAVMSIIHEFAGATSA